MSAATRLWRRAPLWRGAVLACLTCAALACLFPSPALQRAIGARFVPAADGDLVATPAFEPTFRDRIGFAGRTLALPPGDWHQLLIVRQRVAGGVAAMSLARFEAGDLTGLLVARASISPSGDGSLALKPGSCHPPDAFATSADARAAAATLTTCWIVRRTALDPAGGGQPGQDPLAGASFDRLHASDITPPVLHLQSAWYTTDGREFLEATLYEPGQADDETRALAQATGRMRRDWSVRLARDLAASAG